MVGKDFPQGKSGSNINADNARINPYAFDVVQVLPKWYGWDKLNTTYKANVVVPGKLENVIIDPTNRLADINALNDAKKCPIITRFDSKVANYLTRIIIVYIGDLNFGLMKQMD